MIALDDRSRLVVSEAVGYLGPEDLVGLIGALTATTASLNGKSAIDFIVEGEPVSAYLCMISSPHVKAAIGLRVARPTSRAESEEIRAEIIRQVTNSVYAGDGSDDFL